MFSTDAALKAGCPLVDKRLNGSKESRVLSRRGDVQVEVTITFGRQKDMRYRWGERWLGEGKVRL